MYTVGLLYPWVLYLQIQLTMDQKYFVFKITTITFCFLITTAPFMQATCLHLFSTSPLWFLLPRRTFKETCITFLTWIAELHTPLALKPLEL